MEQNKNLEIILQGIQHLQKEMKDLKVEIKEDLAKLENKIDLLTQQNNENSLRIVALETKYGERVHNCNNRFKNLNDLFMTLREETDKKIEALEGENKDKFSRAIAIISIVLSSLSAIFLIVRILLRG